MMIECWVAVILLVSSEMLRTLATLDILCHWWWHHWPTCLYCIPHLCCLSPTLQTLRTTTVWRLVTWQKDLGSSTKARSQTNLLKTCGLECRGRQSTRDIYSFITIFNCIASCTLAHSLSYSEHICTLVYCISTIHHPTLGHTYICFIYCCSVCVSTLSL